MVNFGLPDTYRIELVGSVAINGTGEDFDYAVRVKEGDPYPIQHFINMGFTPNRHSYEGFKDIDDNFESFSRNKDNVLLCYNEQSFDRFVNGRDFCLLLKELGVDMSSKKVRVALHAMASNGSLEQCKKDLARFK